MQNSSRLIKKGRKRPTEYTEEEALRKLKEEDYSKAKHI